jgi:putative transposase
VTDKLAPYDAARRKIMPKVAQRQHKGLNNRAENSHVLIRKPERGLQGFRARVAIRRNLLHPLQSFRSA